MSLPSVNVFRAEAVNFIERYLGFLPDHGDGSFDAARR
jgi:hypothetical protein